MLQILGCIGVGVLVLAFASPASARETPAPQPWLQWDMTLDQRLAWLGGPVVEPELEGAWALGGAAGSALSVGAEGTWEWAAAEEPTDSDAFALEAAELRAEGSAYRMRAGLFRPDFGRAVDQLPRLLAGAGVDDYEAPQRWGFESAHRVGGDHWVLAGVSSERGRANRLSFSIAGQPRLGSLGLDYHASILRGPEAKGWSASLSSGRRLRSLQLSGFGEVAAWNPSHQAEAHYGSALLRLESHRWEASAGATWRRIRGAASTWWLHVGLGWRRVDGSRLRVALQPAREGGRWRLGLGAEWSWSLAGAAFRPPLGSRGLSTVSR